jgi:hypothetical protein
VHDGKARLSHKSDGGYPDLRRDQKKFFQSGKKSKNRLRFFDFLPLFKILFAAAGGDSTYETASAALDAQNLAARCIVPVSIFTEENIITT